MTRSRNTLVGSVVDDLHKLKLLVSVKGKVGEKDAEKLLCQAERKCQPLYVSKANILAESIYVNSLGTLNSHSGLLLDFVWQRTTKRLKSFSVPLRENRLNSTHQNY